MSEDNLPKFHCFFNNLTELPLPHNLRRINCYKENLTELPILPPNLTYLSCCCNKLKELPQLPPNLTYLDCGGNELKELPQLPINLTNLKCVINKLIALPKLPLNLTSLLCHYNKLYKLPPLTSATQRCEAPGGGKQTIIHFKNNFTLKNIIINFIIKNPLLINNTPIPDDLTNIILNSKLFRCDICLYNLPECTKYKKEYYMDNKWGVCCYELSCINCNCKKIV